MSLVARGNTTSFFEELYAIVVGLGLALGVEQVIDLRRDGIPVDPKHLALFFAYLNFSFTLAHASVRYLQLAYLDSELGRLRRGRVVGDLVLGVGHFLWLIVLSFLISRPDMFLWTVIVLLVGRPVRDGVLAIAGRPRLDFDRKVAVVHIAVILMLLGVLLIGQLVGEEARDLFLRGGGVLASIVFGLGLYLFAFEFFFPAEDRNA